MNDHKKLILFLIAIVAAVLMSDACFAQDAAQAASAEPSWTEKLYFWFKDHMNYWTIIILMAIESSVIPLPSEVVVPPAAYFSLQANSSLDFWLVILVATVGAYLGSAINYGLSMLIGRPIIYAFADSKVGHFLHLSKEKMERAEQYFQQKGSVSIFFGRLLPAVRHLISIPAGLSRMNFATFSFFTIVGAGIWNIVLAGLGYLLYRIVPDDTQFFAQLEHYNHYLKIAGFIVLGAVIVFIIYKVVKNKKTRKQEDEITRRQDNKKTRKREDEKTR